MQEKQIPIWFFVGGLLGIYGLLICVAGLYGWMHPPAPAHMVKLWQYHADVWWGALLFGIGLLYLFKFRPSKSETLTGETTVAEKPELKSAGNA